MAVNDMIEEIRVSRIFVTGLQEEIEQLKERIKQLEAELAAKTRECQ